MSILSGISANINTQSATNGASFSVPEQTSSTAGLTNLSPGQSITGKVVSLEGNDVSIKLASGQTINATLDGSANITEGQNITFELKGVSNNQITLSPLYTNTANSMAAIKALNFANIPVTESNVAMTNTMMENGKSIDAASLNSMLHLSKEYPDAKVSDLIAMKDFGIEYTKDNVASFSAFRNFENQITSGINDILNEIPGTVSSLINEGSDAEAAKLASDVIRIFAGDIQVEMSESNPDSSEMPMLDANAVNNGNASEVSNGGIAEKLSGISNENANKVPKDVVNLIDSETVVNDPKEVTEAKAKVIISEDGAIISSGNQPKNEGPIGDISKVLNTNGLDKDSWQSMSTFEKATILDTLKEAGLSEQDAKNLLADTATNKEVLTKTLEILDKGVMNEPLKQFLSSDKFADILKDQAKSELLLKPEDVSDKQKVEDLYKRIELQTKALTDSLTSIAKADTPLANSLNNMNNNLDFMNQMNNVYQYIQLPLKLAGGETTGDLYVYTNKKNMASSDGSVSALLHLDMANLGPMDVYASITPGNNVHTKFYLQDDATIDFIEANIHILNERLEMKGYNMTSDITTKDNMKANEAFVPSSGAVSSEGGAMAKAIMKYSFDMRA